MVCPGAYSRNPAYDGSNWTQLPDDTSLSQRVKFGMAYDENRQVTVVFGGEITGGVLVNDTWEYDGTKWTKKTPARRRPQARLSSDVLRRGPQTGARVWRRPDKRRPVQGSVGF